MSDENNTGEALAAVEPAKTQVEMVPVDTLTIAGLIRPQPRWGDEDPRYTALVADIRERGVLNPINADENGVVWDGFDRLRASKAAGKTHIPVIRCTAEEGPKIAFGSLLHRKHHTKSQRIYAAYPYFMARHEAALARNRARLKSGGSDIGFGGNEESVESMCAQLGVSAELFYQAKRIYDCFVARPDLKELFEPQIMDDEASISLGQAWAGINGHLSTAERGGPKPPKPGKIQVLLDGFSDLAKRFKHWGNFEDEASRERAVTKIRASLDKAPDDLIDELRKAINQVSKQRRDASAE